MGSKAQIESIDFLLALGLFMITLAIVVIDWNLYASNLADNIDYSTMIEKVNSISDILVSSGGIPPNWTTSDVTLPGLALSDRNLSMEKIMNFTNMTSANLKTLLKINGYNFNISMVYSNGTSVVVMGTDLENSSTAVNTRRHAVYKNETVYLDFQIGK